MPTYPFLDPISDRRVELVIGNDPTATGVVHGDCDRLAGVSVALDAFYCPECHWNGRVSGAWVADMWDAHNAR